MLILWKVLHQCTFFLASTSFMVIGSWSCLRRRRFWLYGNQPHSAMGFLLGYTSVNAFYQVLLTTGIISVGSNSISPIIYSILKVSISCFDLNIYIYIFMFRSVLLSLLLATMMFHKEHQKWRSICDFCHICIEKNTAEKNHHVQQPTSEE